jgi:type IV pilus assembly protein PilE
MSMIKQTPMAGNKGFTLIEVMITVVIVAILAAIAYPSYTRYVQNTREAETKGLIMEYASQLEAFRAKNFAYPATETDAKTLAPGDLYSSDAYAPVYRRSSPHAYTITATPKGVMADSGKSALVFDAAAGGPQWDEP